MPEKRRRLLTGLSPRLGLASAGLILLAGFLAACSTPNVEAANPTNTPITPEGATPTPNPETPTPSIPTIEVDGLKLPDPKMSNPELFDVTKQDSPIVEFANAFGVTPQEVGELTPEVKTAADGTQFAVLTTSDLPSTADFDESGTPLMIAEQGENGEWVWKDTRRLADLVGVNFGVQGISEAMNNTEYKENLQYFNQIVIDGELHWGGPIVPNKKLRPGADQFNFTWANKVVDFAEQNDMNIQAHHLVWGINFPGPDGNMITAIPEWLSTGNYTKEQLIQIMHDHISTVMNEYPYVKTWSVVNEPYTYSLGADFWFEKLGEGYIETAFKFAREANPSALLILNDTDNLTTGQRSNFGYQELNRLVKEGYSNLGYGFQGHIDGSNPPSFEQMKENFKRFTDSGIEILLTELDVDMSRLSGTPEEKVTIQAKIYQNVIRAFLEAGGTDFSIFGASDKVSWYEYTGKPDANATLFNDDGEPKQAYYAIQQTLLQKLSGDLK